MKTPARTATLDALGAEIMRNRSVIVVFVLGVLFMGGGLYFLMKPQPPRQVPGGDPDRGRLALLKYGCGSCHRIPGVEGATGTRGQPLAGLALRYDIVGMLANTPEDVVRWIRFPKQVYPQSVMPNLNVTQQDALDMVAYLYTLPPEPPKK